MTDRSSEERSRTWTPLVEVIRREMLARFSDKLSMEEIASCAYAVAALEDRQEAAPVKNASNTTAEELAAWNKYGQYWWRNGYNSGLEHGGVPSEATPSKEGPCPFASNSPWFQQHPELCRRCAGDGTVMVGGHSQELQDAVRSTCLHCEGTGKEPCADQSSAPAPEVQGTPEKCPKCGSDISSGAHGPWCPKPTCKWGWEVEMDGSPLKVPEGVQGKEPQPFYISPILTGEDATRFLEAMELAKKTPPARLEYLKQCARESIAAEKEGVSPDEPRAYKSGEAAGRRSAITELQETVADWGRRSRDASFVEACDWCLKKCAELLEKP